MEFNLDDLEKKIVQIPLKPGTKQAVCIAVYDLGTHLEKKFSSCELEEKRSIVIFWEFPNEQKEIEVFDKEKNEKIKKKFRSQCFQKYSFFVSEGSNLGKLLKNWLGTDGLMKLADKNKNISFRNLLGVNALVNVEVKEVQNKKGDMIQVYKLNSVAGTLPETKDFKPIRTSYFSFKEFPEQPIPPDIPEWIRNKILTSKEYKESCGLSSSVTVDEILSDSEEVPF